MRQLLNFAFPSIPLNSHQFNFMGIAFAPCFPCVFSLSFPLTIKSLIEKKWERVKGRRGQSREGGMLRGAKAAKISIGSIGVLIVNGRWPWSELQFTESNRFPIDLISTVLMSIQWALASWRVIFE